MNEKIVFKKLAQDALIVKEIQFGVVKTQAFIEGKQGYIDNKDIKRLGYADLNEYITALKEQGYTQEQ